MLAALDQQKRETMDINASAARYTDLTTRWRRSNRCSTSSRSGRTRPKSRRGCAGRRRRTTSTSSITPQLPAGRFNVTMRKNLQSAFPLGVVLGLAAIFFLEYMDRSIKTPEELERVTKFASLGVIPSGELRRPRRLRIRLWLRPRNGAPSSGDGQPGEAQAGHRSAAAQRLALGHRRGVSRVPHVAAARVGQLAESHRHLVDVRPRGQDDDVRQPGHGPRADGQAGPADRRRLAPSAPAEGLPRQDEPRSGQLPGREHPARGRHPGHEVPNLSLDPFRTDAAESVRAPRLRPDEAPHPRDAREVRVRHLRLAAGDGRDRLDRPRRECRRRRALRARRPDAARHRAARGRAAPPEQHPGPRRAAQQPRPAAVRLLVQEELLRLLRRGRSSRTNRRNRRSSASDNIGEVRLA